MRCLLLGGDEGVYCRGLEAVCSHQTPCEAGDSLGEDGFAWGERDEFVVDGLAMGLVGGQVFAGDYVVFGEKAVFYSVLR